MRFVLMIEAQQGVSYADQVEIARHAEAAGFEAMFRSDHYGSFPGPEDNPTTDAWAVLAGLARETTRIGLGVLVSPVTFRHPGNVAKLATTVDEMSGGRLEVGVGAGWNDVEHARYGFAFPPIEERADMLEETLEILHGLWEGPDGWSFEGAHWQVRDARTRPRPGDLPERRARGETRPRLLVGGGGSPRSIRIAVRYADEFNLTSSSPAMAGEKYAQLDAALAAAGRDPATLTRSAMIGVLVGADEAELRRRERDLLTTIGADEAGDDWFAERRERWIIGTPDEARAAVRRFADAGVERIMLQDFLPWDLEHIDLLGHELVGRV
ncbi:MAG TPA: TIGR03560 family F420-dependent LLM class oxidoreductase [Candidatus Limnocylindrales bacterium]|nr:TIGR03560 family F420-dependent LLM class oxidoreductase [Candidatus Limnocylindrales bacterium]